MWDYEVSFNGAFVKQWVEYRCSSPYGWQGSVYHGM